MKFINNYYQIVLLQMTALFIITVPQSYLALIDVAALSCDSPQTSLLDAVLYDNLIAIIVITPIFSLLEKLIHRADIRLFLHTAIVLTTWAVVNTNIWIERNSCNGLSVDFPSDFWSNVLLNFALPMAVGAALYIPFYRWSRKATVLLKR